MAPESWFLEEVGDQWFVRSQIRKPEAFISRFGDFHEVARPHFRFVFDSGDGRGVMLHIKHNLLHQYFHFTDQGKVQ